MRLENALKHFSPKSLMISDSSKATASERLTGVDIMGALGMAQSRARLGFALFFAKHQKDKNSRETAIKFLTNFAMEQAPKSIGKITGQKMARAISILSCHVVNVHCRTADDPGVRCIQCKGRKQVAPIILAGNAGLICDYALMGENEGQISQPEKKDCPRCHGTGIKPMPSSRAHRAVKALLPDLHERTWRRNWKPLYDILIAYCKDSESKAEIEFQNVTRT